MSSVVTTMGVILFIWITLFLYLVCLEVRIRKLEKRKAEPRSEASSEGG
jgi:CcmD family protein